MDDDRFVFCSFILWQNATSKLPTDKAVTRRDAEGVTGEEMRNNPDLTTHPARVAASMTAAARLNLNK